MRRQDSRLQRSVMMTGPAKRVGYFRSQVACLEGRGYTVR
jgi:hypothetical protein